ncbi:MAG: FAD-dependent monooxygenase [Bacillota bacterium]|nr:FAD-dependent monooxygenase [Bacillota bacterium]
MINIERDVIVVGAGPAGSICAAYLAKAGADVLLLDKENFPRDKACGDIQRSGFVSHINELGAFEQLDKIGTCLRRIRLISDDGRGVNLPFECYCTPRAQLDSMLVDTALKLGVEFRQNCRVTGLVREGGYVKGVTLDSCGTDSRGSGSCGSGSCGKINELRSKLVVVADGTYSGLAKELGIMKEKSSAICLGQRAYFKGVKLDRKLAADQYDAYGMFFFDASVKPCYFWVLPSGEKGVPEGYCNVGMMVYDRDTYKGMDLQERFYRWREKSPEIKGIFDGAEQVSPWQGGKLTDMTQNMQKSGDGFLVVGDAASVMMPMMNDGMSAAADSAGDAAKAAMEALKKDNFSGEFLSEHYRSGADVSAEDLKLTRLMMQSMYDPKVMDQIIERLGRDKAYRNRIISQLQQG